MWWSARCGAVGLVGCALLTAWGCSAPDPIGEEIAAGLLPAKVVDGEQVRFVIEDRMAYYEVPAVSVAVIDDLEIRWADAWGVRSTGSAEMHQVTTQTLFQAASVSKPVAAVGALSLVADGLLTLDADIGAYTGEWLLPREGYREAVTLRRLLSHSAGTGVGGFAGYDSEDAVPTLRQILEGQPPASSPAVRVVVEPGTAFRYSGGGYLVVQQAMQEVTGKSFADVMNEQVLEPLGLTSSMYAPLSPADAQRAASGHVSGEPLPELGPIHVESAAGGLWTTPADLATLLIELMHAYRGGSDTVITQELARQMLETHFWSFGLGVRVLGDGEDLRFSHGGATRGWHCHVLAFPERGEGVAVMTNGENGWLLWAEVERAVAEALGWPIPLPEPITSADLADELLEEYAGEYSLGGAAVVLSRSGQNLVLELGSLQLQLIPTEPEEELFEIFEVEGQATFERDERGGVTGFELWVGEPDWSPYRRWQLERTGP